METALRNSIEGDIDAQNVLGAYKLPSHLSRTVAYIMDATIVFGAVFYLNSHITVFEMLWPLLFSCGFMYAIYITFFVYFTGKTLGYLLWGLRVIPLKKKRISFLMAFLRGGVAASLVTFPFSPFMLIAHVIHMVEKRKDKLKRTVWDVGSGTVVVKSWR
ncbi:MAG: hypothetical protein C4532_19115 [Candidatus Abyssobacteria bacterium SURF_17]|jgi:uncharacterized RDD family membrane protein YckC|uniref:RDD domain-containing protein n=1 Tax=Candidatus Abyssobacteria bacterium SURF_17 TaxID=2093361 RepID=A0A419ENY2_9BACT|nr:MAG: hypothetical protein C4532_19115 [Candidatus Abyssubacteria bacterium SURF_17]